ncbi:hypothetical protein GCM10011344_33770 [Dokdonia pacifica]|uniref:Uncharacterized protein n=1 Tax=Dokdonia pacifica TaxID=1627892 RepID=A0A239BCI0_9FLAO|nr:hypothetical protein [Dokdonia pacifica]GGG30105.1 hypothetical protein GCM10011344_33770 [Dokdonia pacifica]SNS05630.1 hypothetical protein SAMN06265376_10677 [Dokdonia pacifica]
MKVNRISKIGIFICVLFSFSAYPQSSLTKVRKPSGDSFYSSEMYQNYLGDKILDRSKFPLSRVDEQIITHGNVIIYDASVKSTIPNKDIIQDGISIINNNVVIKSNNKVRQIPIKYINDSPATKHKFSPTEIKLIEKYILKSIDDSGITPSSIEVNQRKSDFDLSIIHSEFKAQNRIIKNYNDITSEAKQIDISNQIDEANLTLAKESINKFNVNYPDKDISYLDEKNNTLLKIKDLNNKSNSNYNIKYIEESENRTSFSVFDGLNPKKEYNIQNKDDFINDIVNESNSNETIQFLKVKGISEIKEDGIFSSISNKINAKKIKIEVKRYPKNNEDIFFYGTLESILNPKYTLINDYSGFNSYVVKVGDTPKEIRLDIDVKPKITREKSKKIIKSFFKFFGRKVKNKATFSESFFDTKKRILKKFDLNNSDYQNIITNQFEQKDIVIIDDLSLFSKDELKIVFIINSK